MSTLLLVARQELVLAARARSIQIFAAVFAVLALAVAGSGYVLTGGVGVQDFARTAAQLVSPGEEPLFFDDLGCLGRYLREHPVRRGAVAYVADHRTGRWVPAREAVYVLQPAASTPMDSHLLGYGSASSRDSDPAARGGRPVPVGDVLGERSPEATR